MVDNTIRSNTQEAKRGGRRRSFPRIGLLTFCWPPVSHHVESWGPQNESSCRDEDFTWVNSSARGEAPRATIDSDRRSTSHTTVGGRSNREGSSNAAGPAQQPPQPGGCPGKPPRPSQTGSLDRRRHLGATRHERDSKSRSTHSLKEKSSSSEFKQDSQSSTLSLSSKGKGSSRRGGTHGKSSDERFWNYDEVQQDSGSCNNYNSSGSSHQNNANVNARGHSPGIWEPPPPPPISHWDPHYYWNWNNHHSREELRLIDYHRRQQELYRYGSNGALSSNQDLSGCSGGGGGGGGGCCNRGFYQPPPPPCCSCEHNRPPWSKDCQRQDTDERLRRLQSDKEAMALQVKLLTDQVQQQGTKISDLERTLADKNQLLANADDLLQRVSQFAKTVGILIDKQKEMLSRSSLETQKLELMSAMSELKLQQAALERENLELRSSLVNGTPLTNGTLTNGAINALNNNTIVTASMLRRAIPMGTSGARMVSSNSSGNTSINTSPLHHGSYGSLPQSQQATSPSPVTPKTPPATYRQRVDLHYSSLPRQAFATTLSTTSGSSGSAHSGLTNGNGTPSVDANANPKQRNVAFAIDPPPKQKQPSIPVGMSSSMNALTLSSALSGSNLKSLKQASASAQNIYSCDERREDEDEQQLIDLGQDHQERATTEPPTGTTLSVAQSNQENLLEAASTPVLAGRDRSSTSSTVDLKTLEMMRGGFSVPNLANTESASSDRTDGQLSTSSQRSYTPQPSPSPSMSHKNLKGLRNIFGKIKRSNSGTLDDLDPLDGAGNGEFKRGGVRATAGPRLGWTNSEFRKPDKPFREWNLDTLCLWFEQMGLGMYEEELRKWLKVGGAAELAAASPVDIEKELSLRNALHRKKIVLAVADVAESEEDDGLLKCAGKLDTAWILRWLEDIGLPQHKDSFTAARMDGRMLHKLTMDDLAHLHVSSCLHVASIRRGIQLMREQKWNPNCFIQRAPTDGTPGETKDNVRLWSCSRVMDWLRLLDLSEYAPNLRGTGVHGALMVFEVKFTAELLAELLSIPPSKTLLRRHLATHFKELLGREIIQVKRDAENTLGFQPLTLAAKIKTPKKSQFSLKRKKSSKGLTGDEWSDYVCPMGDSGQDHLPPHLQTQHNSSQSQSSTSNKSAVVSATTNNTASIAATTTNATNVTTARDNGAQLVASSCTSSSSSSSAANNNNAQQHPSFAANPNHVTSNNAALAMTKSPYSTYHPDSSISSTSSSSTAMTSGPASEAVSHQQLLSNNTGSDSPTSTRSSTTSTS
ncbi:liprin-beta-1 isoform X6 [Culex pipiens pallens]|uniref:liprin-beta-1 isoform X6 n=1 Tax=Culex pipiens pallens TaxID=42434 RepID=UPI001954D7D3|nr:liprin-beta-1 isoform X6 [Culex pipiens pallens]